jgi:hypothetical protein
LGIKIVKVYQNPPNNFEQVPHEVFDESKFEGNHDSLSTVYYGYKGTECGVVILRPKIIEK